MDINNPHEVQAFFNAYLACALWSSNDESRPDGGDPMDQNYDVSDIAPETHAEMLEHCADFMAQAEPYLEHWEASQAGHDFWLTRNGHGAGFWDRYSVGEPHEHGDKLTEISYAFGEYALYVGDDGKIYG